MKKSLFRPYEWTGRVPADSDSRPVIVRPLTYMNRSGEVFPGLLRRTRSTVDDLVVICDNLDLPAGAVRLKRSGTSRSHNGIASLMDALGTGDFLRLYIGIGRPGPGASVVDHVLGRPDADEESIYDTALDSASAAVNRLQSETIETVMNDLNRRP